MKLANLGIRAKLSLIAVAVVSVLYLVLGMTVFFVARQAIFTSIDSGLQKMAQGFDRHHRRPPPDHQHDMPPDMDRMGPQHDGGDNHMPFSGDLLGIGPPEPTGQFYPPDQPRQERLEPVDIHDGRPKVVWKLPDARFPFPKSTPLDSGAIEKGKQGISTLHTVNFDDEPIRVLTIPVYSLDGPTRVEGVMEMTYWLGDVDRVLNTLAGTLFLILPVGIILMGTASMYVVGKTLRPVREIRTAAARIEAADLSGRLPVTGKDEFAELAETMNGMFQRLDTAFAGQRQTLEQLKEVILQQRRFTADASHELKTPLTIIKINASLLKPALDRDPDALESIGAIDQAVNRMSKLVQDLLLLARTDSGQIGESFESVDLAELARTAARLVPCSSRVVVHIGPEPMIVEGSKFGLERVFTNLLDNACRHSEAGTEVRLEIHRQSNQIAVQVIDCGEGIPAEHLDKIFTRFHRIDASRHSETGGTGLGLAICKGIVEAHGGSISVESVLSQGAAFTVRLKAQS